MYSTSFPKFPAVWDKTLPLQAKLSEYIVTAKQKGNDWYVGGMTNWDARSTEVNLSFLKDNVFLSGNYL